MELPIFHGYNALAWINECESIFQLTGIQNEAKIKWANAHIRGKAKVWLENMNYVISSAIGFPHLENMNPWSNSNSSSKLLL
jgi:hypothetical protein